MSSKPEGLSRGAVLGEGGKPLSARGLGIVRLTGCENFISALIQCIEL